MSGEKKSGNSMWKSIRKSNMTAITAVLIIMLIIASVATPYFLDPYNIQSLFRDLAFIGMIGVAQSLLLLVGELDLSVGKMASLCGVLCGMMIMYAGLNPWLAMVLGIASAQACGPENGKETPADTRELSVSPATAQVGHEAAECSFTVKTNFEYKVVIDVDWIAVKSASPTSLVLNINENTSVTPREADVRLVDRNDRYWFKTVKVVQDKNPVRKVRLSIVDKNATAQTKALYANLWDLAGKGFMFGHHDDLWYGRHWYDEPGGSDTKAVCGDYPAVFSVDLASIMDNRYRSNSKENEIRRRVILEARERGEVILACIHINNPLTIVGNENGYPAGTSWDNTKCIDQILKEGTEVRGRYIEWLDRLADFACNLKDSKGELIPVIFRPYHECTQSWSGGGPRLAPRRSTSSSGSGRSNISGTQRECITSSMPCPRRWTATTVRTAVPVC